MLMMLKNLKRIGLRGGDNMKNMSPRLIFCQHCGCPVPCFSFAKRYCIDCYRKKDRERKRNISVLT